MQKFWKILNIFYTVSKANLDLGKNILLLENPQFLPNHNETWDLYFGKV